MEEHGFVGILTDAHKKVLFVNNYEERWMKGGDPIRQGWG